MSSASLRIWASLRVGQSHLLIYTSSHSDSIAVYLDLEQHTNWIESTTEYGFNYETTVRDKLLCPSPALAYRESGPLDYDKKASQVSVFSQRPPDGGLALILSTSRE